MSAFTAVVGDVLILFLDRQTARKTEILANRQTDRQTTGVLAGGQINGQVINGTQTDCGVRVKSRGRLDYWTADK